MNFDNKWFWGALIAGVVVVFVLMRRGGGSGSATMVPLPSSDSGSADRATAFSGLVDLGRTELEANRDLSLGRIQGSVELDRIGAAERASLAESRAQIQAAQIQANAQSSSDFFGFLGSLLTTTIPLVA